MMTLYRTQRQEGAAAEETLDELCLAHKTVMVESAEDLPPELAGEGEPPVLVDEHDVIHGIKDILAHLEKLERFRALWYKYQSDVCYCEDEDDLA
ncbi:MAG: hypothetical protein IH624_09965 [Phycisphaerae bacterium]|nr:hypothetical protein [Phycisphaerae bacterium]